MHARTRVARLALHLAPVRAAPRASAAAARPRALAAMASSLRIHQFPALADNYGYLVHDEATGATAAVDTPEARRKPSALLAALPQPRCWRARRGRACSDCARRGHGACLPLRHRR
jgi:hypothetical protein